ncbi:sodium-dependent organic anion transporter-like [Diadema antillarum]|uniref:sodium-dependent organic anion transporter-like n=1 Tax=Diadema antillarum TaxID=105358 RepID=UPI003A8494BB
MRTVVILTSLMVLFSTVRGQCGTSTSVNITYAEDTVYVYEGSEANVTLYVTEVTENGILTMRSEKPRNFDLVDTDFSENLTTGDIYPRNISVTIAGKFIDIGDLEILFTPEGGQDALSAGSQTVGVRRVPRLIQVVYIWVILAWVVISYISMGGSMDLKAIWEKVRRPWGVLIGIFCQFIIMPAMTYAIAILVTDEPTAAIGIVLVGTCPGGWLSNIFSVLLDVDFVLSVTMTFFSSIIALGMMPLNLFIYSTPFTRGDSRLSTPYVELVQQLVILVLPVFIGIALSYKFPKFKKFCAKVIKPVSALLIIVGLSLGIPADLYAYTTSPLRNWIASIITPACGAFFGLAFARIFGRNVRTSITIALETGVQNALLGRTIVALFYPQPEADLIARVQLTVVLVTLIEGTLASILYSCFRYLVCRSCCEKMMAPEEDEKQEDAAVAVDDVEPKMNYESNGNTGHPMSDTPGTDNPGFELKEA